MVEENNSFVITKNGHDLLNEAQLVTQYFLNTPETDINIERIKGEFPFLKTFDVSKISSLFQTFEQPARKNNILLGGIILFIVSQGKYPQDLWPDALKDKMNTRLSSLKKASNDYKAALGDLLPLNYKSEFNYIIKDFKRKEIMPFVDDKLRVPGWVCLFETFYETFVEKYDLYAPRIYSKLFEQYKNKTFHKREYLQISTISTLKKPNKDSKKSFTVFSEKETVISTNVGKIRPYAISFAGNMDKPGHADCEDCSMITTFECRNDQNIVLMAVCDGVGSAIDSETGSISACVALREVLNKFIGGSGIAKSNKGSSGSEANFGCLINYIQNNLAKEVHALWEKLVMENSAYFKDKQAGPRSMEQFTTTMQFAIITPLFTALGKIGDGSFYVRKREINGSSDLNGIFSVTDGRSDVLEKSVFNVALLKNDPAALQISIINTKEIKDILITSDGVSPLFRDDMVRACNVMNDLYGTPYQERTKKIEKMARNGSDVNTIDFSSGGDDASVAYVSFGNEV